MAVQFEICFLHSHGNDGCPRWVLLKEDMKPPAPVTDGSSAAFLVLLNYSSSLGNGLYEMNTGSIQYNLDLAIQYTSPELWNGLSVLDMFQAKMYQQLPSPSFSVLRKPNSLKLWLFRRSHLGLSLYLLIFYRQMINHWIQKIINKLIVSGCTNSTSIFTPILIWITQPWITASAKYASDTSLLLNLTSVHSSVWNLSVSFSC